MATIEVEEGNVFTFEDTENVLGIEEPDHNNTETEFTNEPVYVSIAGIFGGGSSSEEDNNSDGPTEKKRAKRESSRRSRKKNPQYDDPDWECDIKPIIKNRNDTAGPSSAIASTSNAIATTSTTVAATEEEEEEVEDQLVALSKKQLNRLAAMDIYPIPSGGIGTVNASLFNPVTVKWLMKNFETVEGSSLPRFLVYNHYLLHCKSLNINPINAASFGKVIRSVFLGLQTRRLGTRGNSKYHYCGMRIKPDSPLLHVTITDTESKKSTKSGGSKNNKNSNSNKNKSKSPLWNTKRFIAWRKINTQDLPDKYLQFGLNELPHTLEHLQPDADFLIPVAEGLNQEDILLFKTHYRNHCSSLLASVDRFRLDMVGVNWQLFYKAEKGDNTYLNRQSQQVINSFRPFTRSKLKKFVSNKYVQIFMNEADKQTYSNMAYLLCPHVTKTVPDVVNQAIRNFLKVVEEWLSDALDSYPEDFKSLKSKTLQNVMRPLEQTLNTNVLYCSTQRMLQNEVKMNDLVSTLNGINFRQINTAVSWVNESEPMVNGEQLKNILSRSDRLQGILTLIEKIVEDRITLNLPINDVKMKLQDVFLEMVFSMTQIRKELVFISKESFETFSCMENFLLEYLKHFTHLRIGMQSVIATSSNSRDTDMDMSNFDGLTSYEMNDIDNEWDEEEENSPTDDEENATAAAAATTFEKTLDENSQNAVSQDGSMESITNGLSDISVRNELDGWQDFLQAVSYEGVEEVPETEKNTEQTTTTTEIKPVEENTENDNATTNQDDYDETFRKYFSASGYVTNYFNKEQNGGTTSDEDENDDDEDDSGSDENDENDKQEKEEKMEEEPVQDNNEQEKEEEEKQQQQQSTNENADDEDDEDDPGVRFSFGLVNS